MTLFADIGDIRLIDMGHKVRITKASCDQDMLFMLVHLPLV